MFVIGCALLSAVPTCAAEPFDLQIRVSWGNGERRLWRGAISISEGSLDSPRCLGIEADAPDRYDLKGNSLEFQQRTPMSLDGIDLRIVAPETAVLSVQLVPLDQPDAEKKVEVRVADFLLANRVVHESQLDDRRNRLILQRTPGDYVRVELDRPSLVFSPDEEFVFDIQPHLLGIPEGTPLRCLIQMMLSGTDEVLWKEQHDARVDALGSVNPLGPISVQVPPDEGVYEIVISLSQRRSFDALVPGKPLFLRKIQFIVVGNEPIATDAIPWTLLEEIDSANPNWWKRMITLLPKKLPGIAAKGPLGDKPLRAVQRGNDRLQELGPSGWHAAPIPIGEVGQPHILEVEFPRGVRQTLGISILEADAAGDVGSKGLDSGIEVGEDSLDAQGLETHRLVFWPRTKSPWLLLTNRRDNGPALFGKMRVYSGPSGLPAPAANPVEGQRLAAAFFDKPLFAENFGAPEALDENSARSLRDWNTFYLSTIRFAEYLKFAGYNAAFVPVMCDGTTLYPSQLLDVTPKWDNGAFFVSAQDPRPKDILEVMLRIFDREGLTLVPVVQFANPLPELETALAHRSEASGGIALLGSYRNEITPSLGANDSRRGLAPSYNPLDPRVQAAMRRVTAELLDRCRDHRSFGGLSLQFSPYGYLQFPDESWGLDDATFTQFAQEHQISLPLEGANQYAARLALTRGPMRARWLKWRAFRLADFYRQLQGDVADVKHDAPVFLDLHDLMAGRVMQAALRPQLPPREQFADALLRHGIDPVLLNDHRELILLRPHRQGQSNSIAGQATNIELGNAMVDEFFQSTGRSGVMTFHERQLLRVPAFDAASPFDPNRTLSWLSSHISLTAEQSRKSFLRSLVTTDATILAHGGWMMPLGQEEGMRPVLQVLTQLPAVRFETVPAADGENQPLVVRTLNRQNATYVYVANATGLRANLDLQLQNLPSDAQFDLLTDRQPSPVARAVGNTMSLRLDSYDLVGFVVRAANVRVASWTVDYDPADVLRVKRTLQEFGARVDGLRDRRQLEVLMNPDFERPIEGNQIPGWSCAPAAGATIQLDRTSHRSGQNSLHFVVSGANVVGKVRSAPFPLPRTGRLAILASLRTRDPNRQPALRMTIEGKLVNGVPIVPMVSEIFGKGVDARLQPNGAMTRPVPTRWDDVSSDFLWQVVDLPAGTAGEVSIGFDMLGAGEAWIDDVKVFDLYLHDVERNELVKQLGNVQLQLNSRKYAACQQFLDSYWPRFVMEFAPPPENRIARQPNAGVPKVEAPAKAEEKPSRWKLKNPLPPLKLPRELF